MYLINLISECRNLFRPFKIIIRAMQAFVNNYWKKHPNTVMMIIMLIIFCGRYLKYILILWRGVKIRREVFIESICCLLLRMSILVAKPEQLLMDAKLIYHYQRVSPQSKVLIAKALQL